MNTNVNLVNYEMSCILKSHGFNYHTTYYFDISNPEAVQLYHADWGGYNEESDKIACPSAETVLQYLRNEHNIDIFICRLSNLTMPNIGYGFLMYVGDTIEPFIWSEPLESYEIAQIRAIDYVYKECNIFNNEDTDDGEG